MSLVSAPKCWPKHSQCIIALAATTRFVTSCCSILIGFQASRLRLSMSTFVPTAAGKQLCHSVTSQNYRTAVCGVSRLELKQPLSKGPNTSLSLPSQPISAAAACCKLGGRDEKLHRRSNGKWKVVPSPFSCICLMPFSSV